MSKILIQNPTPLPPPKFAFFVSIVAFAAIIYLLGAVLTAERELGNKQGSLER